MWIRRQEINTESLVLLLFNYYFSVFQVQGITQLEVPNNTVYFKYKFNKVQRFIQSAGNVQARNYVPRPKGWGTYCFWCGSRRRCQRRRQRRRSFLSAQYLLNHWMDLDQTGTETSLGQPNGVIRFR